MNTARHIGDTTTMIPLDTTLRAARMIEAGRVTVTFRSPTGQHITITAKCRAQVDGRWTGVPLAQAMVVFFEVPGASGSWADKVGKYTRSGGFVADRNADEARVWCAKQLIAFVAGQPLAPGLEAFEESRCGACGRALTDPVSIERGIGPECYGRMTGSEHQHKIVAGTTKAGAATTAPAVSIARSAHEQAEADGTHAFAQLEIARDQALEADIYRQVPGTNVEAAPNGRTRPVRRQTRAQRDALQTEANATKRGIPECRQQQDDKLNGTTWEDIFRPAAEAQGITLP